MVSDLQKCCKDDAEAPQNVHPVSLTHHFTSRWYVGLTWNQHGWVTTNSTPHLFGISPLFA